MPLVDWQCFKGRIMADCRQRLVYSNSSWGCVNHCCCLFFSQWRQYPWESRQQSAVLWEAAGEGERGGGEREVKQDHANYRTSGARWCLWEASGLPTRAWHLRGPLQGWRSENGKRKSGLCRLCSLCIRVMELAGRFCLLGGWFFKRKWEVVLSRLRFVPCDLAPYTFRQKTSSQLCLLKGVEN